MAETSVLIPLLTAGATVAASAALRPKAPKPQAPLRMPDPESPEVLEARRRRIAERQSAGGRESTILTEDEPYSNSVLGE